MVGTKDDFTDGSVDGSADGSEPFGVLEGTLDGNSDGDWLTNVTTAVMVPFLSIILSKLFVSVASRAVWLVSDVYISFWALTLTVS